MNTQLQTLAAIQSLSQRMVQFEALRSSSPSLLPVKEGVPTIRQQKARKMIYYFFLPPILFLMMHSSWEKGANVRKPILIGHEGGASFKYTSAKIVGLQSPLPDPDPVGSVWEGISQTNFTPCIPVADDYTSMLRSVWKKLCQKPQFNEGCRWLANARYSTETCIQ